MKIYLTLLIYHFLLVFLYPLYHYKDKETIDNFNAKLAKLHSLGSDTVIKYRGPKVNIATLNTVVICNHSSSYDFMHLMNYFARMGQHKDLVFVGKKSLKFIPGFGWFLNKSSNILIDREWDSDKYILQQIKNVKNKIIIIFPEGTRFDEYRLNESQQYAKSNGFPVLNSVLLPRYKGLYFILKKLINNSNIDYLYDLTIKFGDNQFHINAEEIKLRLIPLSSKTKFRDWLFFQYEKKDELLKTIHKEKFRTIKSIKNDSKYNKYLSVTVGIIILIIVNKSFRNVYVFMNVLGSMLQVVNV
jgi:lysocardiolipin and lysophospholipid acyltransferase